jgi:hypothetical protein
VKRRQVILVIVAFVIVAGTAIVVEVIRSPQVQKRLHPPVLVIPSDEEVTEVRASLRDTFGDHPGFAPVPEFVVPAEHVSNILGRLRPAEYARNPPILPGQEPFAEVIIRTQDNRELRLLCFWTGHNPVAFTVDRVDYFYGRHDRGPPAIDGGAQLGLAIETASKSARK